MINFFTLLWDEGQNTVGFSYRSNIKNTTGTPHWGGTWPSMKPMNDYGLEESEPTTRPRLILASVLFRTSTTTTTATTITNVNFMISFFLAVQVFFPALSS